MNTMGIDQNLQYEIFRLLAAILWLGNVQFTADESDHAVIADRRTLELFASLFGTDAAAVERSLLFRSISTGTGVGKKGSVYSVPQNPTEAIYSRDALAKTLYSRYEMCLCLAFCSGVL